MTPVEMMLTLRPTMLLLVTCAALLNSLQAYRNSYQKALKHRGDIRPWVPMFRRVESVEDSYDTLVTVLTGKNRLDLVGLVNRMLNLDIMEITRSVKEVFDSLEKVQDANLHLVLPSYYLLTKKTRPNVRDSAMTRTFKSHRCKYIDSKFWTSISAMQWMATFLDPSFKQIECISEVISTPSRSRKRVSKRYQTHDLSYGSAPQVPTSTVLDAPRELTNNSQCLRYPGP